MSYSILRFAHIIGFILLGGGLIGVFVADLRSRRASEVKAVAEACQYVSSFYDGFVVTGAVLAGVSGLLLTLKAGLGFFQSPWQTGMWTLFVFEFAEGNTITRIHFRRMLRLSKEALANGELTGRFLYERSRKLPTFTHFLDLPLFFLIVSFGALRPAAWGSVFLWALLAVIAGTALMFALKGKS